SCPNFSSGSDLPSRRAAKVRQPVRGNHVSDYEKQSGGKEPLDPEMCRWLGGEAEDELAALIVALELAGDEDGFELRQARLALREALSGGAFEGQGRQALRSF